ncbi:unnamed protein product [Caenorhabditis auriculariae]|uniref:Uncharacterized protein n=1 Tax=Caenorhabditis auriculariae TaxID=2777116 RepID=A0A8S1H4I6_9PELO|nr:unnamed protein product [Caenorhabditis auriculariae]
MTEHSAKRKTNVIGHAPLHYLTPEGFKSPQGPASSDSYCGQNMRPSLLAAAPSYAYHFHPSANTRYQNTTYEANAMHLRNTHNYSLGNNSADVKEGKPEDNGQPPELSFNDPPANNFYQNPLYEANAMRLWNVPNSSLGNNSGNSPADVKEGKPQDYGLPLPCG